MNSKSTLRDWSDMRLFLAIVDRGSLVGAAEHLELTQPTVGRRLAALEERYDTPLFVRTGRRMQLTDAGAGILESARRMEREMLAIERSLEVQSKALCGAVTISATEGTGTDWLTPVLYDFHRAYPEIVVKVQIENRAVDLLHREADIALRMGQPAQGALIARRLVTVGFGLYASPAYLERAGVPATVEDLAQHEMVALDTLGTRGDAGYALPGGDPLPGNYVYLTNSPGAQMAAVRAGFGIGPLSHRWTASTGGLTRVLPDFTPLAMDLWLVSHEELRYSARIRAVSDFIAARVLNDAGLFEHGAQ